jgi:hypothetical protein
MAWCLVKHSEKVTFTFLFLLFTFFFLRGLSVVLSLVSNEVRLDAFLL